MLLAGIRLLVGAGLPALDVADAMYGNPRVVDELRDGTPQAAKQAVIEHLRDALDELRAAAEPQGDLPDSGIPEASLRMMTAAGFAAGEIASALRSDAESARSDDAVRLRAAAADASLAARNVSRPWPLHARRSGDARGVRRKSIAGDSGRNLRGSIRT